jgi:hypothetical protein
MTSRAPVAAKDSVVAAGNDLEPEVINNEGSSVNVGSLKAEMYGDPDDVRGLETTNEGPDVGTVNVDILNDEKIDWVLVGDSASLRGCEDISMSAWDKGGVLIAAGLVVAVTDDEGEIAIEGDEIAWKVVEGSGKSSRLELTPWPASGLLCCPETELTPPTSEGERLASTRLQDAF